MPHNRATWKRSKPPMQRLHSRDEENADSTAATDAVAACPMAGLGMTLGCFCEACDRTQAQGRRGGNPS